MLKSLWQLRTPHLEESAPTTAAAHGEWDVVVVGAGITGLTTALKLLDSGLSVLVIEGREVGAGTTARSSAKISLAQGTQLSRVARHHPEAVLQTYVDANVAAQQWLIDFCAGAGVPLDVRTAYTYATTATGERAARSELDQARQVGLDATWVEETPLPFATRGALALPRQRQVDPVQLLRALLSAVGARGGTVVEHDRVTRIHGHDPVSVTTERGQASAGAVVVATNAPILDRGGYFARLSAARSYCLAYRTGDATPSPQGMFLSTDQPSRSLRDAAGSDGRQLLLVGGNGHGTGRASSPAARLDEIRSWTLDSFGQLEEVAAWSAQDYVPHHGLPFAGPVLPGRDDVLVAGGYSKWGMTNGVAAAHVVAARIVGQDSPFRDAFPTWSARELRGLPTAARANTEVGLALTGGWLRPLTRIRPDAAPPAEGDGRVTRNGLRAPVAVSTVDGVTRRVSGVCTHLGGVVTWNDAERSWDCPLHGSRFDRDGAVLEGVATCGLATRRPPSSAAPENINHRAQEQR